MRPSEILRLDRKHVFRKPFAPFIIGSARGSTITDVYGKKYIDLLGGLYGAISIGWQDPEVIRAMKMQMDKCNFAPERAPSAACSMLAKDLVDLTGGKLQKCLRATSGTEAVELAIKASRAYSQKKRIISAYNSYHGQGYAGMSIQGSHNLSKVCGPLLPRIDFMPFPYSYRANEKGFGSVNECLEKLRNRIRIHNDVCAVIIEPVQGEGVIAPSLEFLKGVREICDAESVLLILDEVITGFGRTGSKFAYMQAAIEPDILILGKGLSSGHAPIATTMLTDDVAMKLERSANTSTFGWNPIAASAALATVRVFSRKTLWERSAYSGEYFVRLLNQLLDCGAVGEIRGRGLFIGIELVKNKGTKDPDPKLADRVMKRCLKNGIYLGVGGPHSNTLILAPPLIIAREEMQEGALQIAEAITKG